MHNLIKIPLFKAIQPNSIHPNSNSTHPNSNSTHPNSNSAHPKITLSLEAYRPIQWNLLWSATKFHSIEFIEPLGERVW